MKIALLFGMFPSVIYSEIVENSKGGVQYAADAFQKSLLEGLGSLYKDVTVLNLPYIGSYPLRYKEIFSPKGHFEYKTGNKNVVFGENIKFLNVTGIKQISRYLKSKQAIIKWCKKYPDDNKILLIYAMHTPFLKAAVDVKNEVGDKYKIILIVPDLPEFMSENTSFIFNYLKKKDCEKLYSLSKDVDGFVFLSKYMTDAFTLDNKKWTVVEGVFNKSHDDVLVNEKLSKNYILYTGTLAKRYGVMNLVRAFSKLTYNNINLVICGKGNSEKEILDYTVRDSRIQYKGQLLRDEVLKLQKGAKLLINPRTPEGEFTKYSFPSKTMEYLASGIPTLIYKLPGIPDEYYNYCYTVDKLGVEALSEKLDYLLQKDENELQEMGIKARNFILKEKTPIPQCKKIIDLINSL